METFPQVIIVRDRNEGFNRAKDILYKKIDNKTLLFLSGGSTPKDLYETLAKEKKLKPKAVGMVDERINRSNFEMIRGAGLLTYFENKKINFYPMINAREYDGVVRKLISSSEKKVAIMGIGEDGHTAGLAAGVKSEKLKVKSYVTDIENFPGEYKNRITLTFNALSQMDLLIVLVFGSNKQNALNLMFDPSAGSGKEAIDEIPVRFYLRPDISSKTILITDQKI